MGSSRHVVWDRQTFGRDLRGRISEIQNIVFQETNGIVAHRSCAVGKLECVEFVDLVTMDMSVENILHIKRLEEL